MLIFNAAGDKVFPCPSMDADRDQPLLTDTGLPLLDKFLEIPSMLDPLSGNTQHLIYVVFYHGGTVHDRELKNPHNEFQFGLCMRSGTTEQPARYTCAWFRDVALDGTSEDLDKEVRRIVDGFTKSALKKLEPEEEQAVRVYALAQWYEQLFLNPERNN